jgi:hypothetical protein
MSIPREKLASLANAVLVACSPFALAPPENPASLEPPLPVIVPRSSSALAVPIEVAKTLATVKAAKSV